MEENTRKCPLLLFSEHHYISLTYKIKPHVTKNQTPQKLHFANIIV